MNIKERDELDIYIGLFLSLLQENDEVTLYFCFHNLKYD